MLFHKDHFVCPPLCVFWCPLEAEVGVEVVK